MVLLPPDGTWYNLSPTYRRSADDIRQAYTVDLSGKATNGTWRLRVSDLGQADTGYINSWTLNL